MYDRKLALAERDASGGPIQITCRAREWRRGNCLMQSRGIRPLVRGNEATLQDVCLRVKRSRG